MDSGSESIVEVVVKKPHIPARISMKSPSIDQHPYINIPKHPKTDIIVNRLDMPNDCKNENNIKLDITNNSDTINPDKDNIKYF